jgi:flagellar operon protein
LDIRIQQLQHQPVLPKINKNNAANKSSKSFQSYLNNAEQKLTLSKHAEKRIMERQININQEQWQNISTKVAQAKAKGITDSLVVLNDALLVVNTKSNTVITALDRKEANDHIFTNINGTILMNE